MSPTRPSPIRWTRSRGQLTLVLHKVIIASIAPLPIDNALTLRIYTEHKYGSPPPPTFGAASKRGKDPSICRLRTEKTTREHMSYLGCACGGIRLVSHVWTTQQLPGRFYSMHVLSVDLVFWDPYMGISSSLFKHQTKLNTTYERACFLS
jgi:hypothetical protein